MAESQLKEKRKEEKRRREERRKEEKRREKKRKEEKRKEKKRDKDLKMHFKISSPHVSVVSTDFTFIFNPQTMQFVKPKRDRFTVPTNRVVLKKIERGITTKTNFPTTTTKKGKGKMYPNTLHNFIFIILFL